MAYIWQSLRILPDCQNKYTINYCVYTVPYKMTHWQEYYLAKHKRKHFNGINIGDFDKMMHVH